MPHDERSMTNTRVKCVPQCLTCQASLVMYGSTILHSRSRDRNYLCSLCIECDRMRSTMCALLINRLFGAATAGAARHLIETRRAGSSPRVLNDYRNPETELPKR
jgi:hypothetical protein